MGGVLPGPCDDPQTRAALAAHQAGALRWLGGGVIAVVLGVLLGVAAVADGRGDRPADPGRRARRPGARAGAAASARRWPGSARWCGPSAGGARWRRSPGSWGRCASPGRRSSRSSREGYDELDPAEPLQLQLLSTAVWRTRLVQGLDGAEVRGRLPVGRGQWVLTADGLGTLCGARVTRRR